MLGGIVRFQEAWKTRSTKREGRGNPWGGGKRKLQRASGKGKGKNDEKEGHTYREKGRGKRG